MHSLVPSAAHCVAQAAVKKHTNIQDVLALFFRDDIIAWSARRSGRHASAGAGIKQAQLRHLVQLNVERTFERLKEVCLIGRPLLVSGG